MYVLSQKLNRLGETVELALRGEIASLAEAFRLGHAHPAIAIGSGGSLIGAEYLALCRRTLQAQPTLVQTPLEFLLGDGDLSQTVVWLFSAGGSNPDILAALKAARIRGCLALHVVTRSPHSELTEAARSLTSAQTHIAPTADPKDGFLATHSLVSATTMMLMAADSCAPGALGGELAQSFRDAVSVALAGPARQAMTDRFAGVDPQGTLFVLHDPRLAPVGLLIETSAWEAALCPVQRTDFRNFAHGRHVWLNHRAESTVILALTGIQTRSVWGDIRSVLPNRLRTEAFDFGNCGRFRNAVGVIQGMCIVEAVGRAVGIDPGRPGAAPFATSLYDAPSLVAVANRLNPAVRHKQAAVDLRDDPLYRDCDLAEAFDAISGSLGAARFAGLVLDYDGTVVTLTSRESPPSDAIVAEIKRLLDEGMRLSVATGRGGSAGERLREAFPEHQEAVVMSYYNGAYSQLLSVNIDQERPPAEPRLNCARAWLSETRGLKGESRFKDSGVQLTIFKENLEDVDDFCYRFEEQFGKVGELRLTRSAHTLDICLTAACKTLAAHALAERTGSSLNTILCIGDSGALGGNDHALLGLSHGISVGQVCDGPDICWSIHGSLLSGPDALLTILKALRLQSEGGHRLEIEALTRAITSTK